MSDVESETHANDSDVQDEVDRIIEIETHEEYENTRSVVMNDRHLWGGFNLGYTSIVIVRRTALQPNTRIRVQFETDYGTSPYTPAQVIATRDYPNLTKALASEPRDRIYPSYYGEMLRKRHATSIDGPVTVLHLQNTEKPKPIDNWNTAPGKPVKEQPVFRYRTTTKK